MVYLKTYILKIMPINIIFKLEIIRKIKQQLIKNGNSLQYAIVILTFRII